jgi:hypothetical protein
VRARVNGHEKVFKKTCKDSLFAAIDVLGYYHLVRRLHMVNIESTMRRVAFCIDVCDKQFRGADAKKQAAISSEQEI